VSVPRITNTKKLPNPSKGKIVIDVQQIKNRYNKNRQTKASKLDTAETHY